MKKAKTPITKNLAGNKSNDKEQIASPIDQHKLSSIKDSKINANQVKNLLKAETIYMHFQDQNGKTKQMPQYNQVIQQMGGQVYKRLTSKVTIIVTNTNKGQFYKKASELNIPVVDNYWLNHCWNLKQKAPFSQLYLMKQKKPIVVIPKKPTEFQQQSRRNFQRQIQDNINEKTHQNVQFAKVLRKAALKDKNLYKNLYIIKPQTIKIPRYQQRLRPGEKRRSLKNRKKKLLNEQQKDSKMNKQLQPDQVKQQNIQIKQADIFQHTNKNQKDLAFQQYQQRLQRKLAQKQAQQKKAEQQTRLLLQQKKVQQNLQKIKLQQSKILSEVEQKQKKQDQIILIKKIKRMQRKNSFDESKKNSNGQLSANKSIISVNSDISDRKSPRKFKYQTAGKENQSIKINSQIKKSTQKLIGFMGSFNFSDRRTIQDQEDVYMQVFSFQQTKQKPMILQNSRNNSIRKYRNQQQKEQSIISQRQNKLSQPSLQKEPIEIIDDSFDPLKVSKGFQYNLPENQINIDSTSLNQENFNSFKKSRLSKVPQRQLFSEKSVTASLSSGKSIKMSPFICKKANKIKQKDKKQARLKKSNSEKSQISQRNVEFSQNSDLKQVKKGLKPLNLIRVHCASYPLIQKIHKINKAKQQKLNDQTRFQISPLPSEQHLYVFDPVSIIDRILACLGPSKAIVNHKFLDYVNTFDTRQLREQQLNSKSFYGRFEQKIEIRKQFIKNKTIFLMDCINSTTLARIIIKAGGKLVGGCQEHYKPDEQVSNDQKIQEAGMDIVIRSKTNTFDGKQFISEQNFLKKILPD